MADLARKKTDKLLQKMEKKVSDIYDRAGKEIEKKTKDFWDAFEKKDAVMRKKLSDGGITEDQYEKWKREQAFTGEHWREMQKTVSAEMLNASKTAAAYVNGQLPEVYALNYNALEEVTSGIKGYSFELVDANTVKNLATSDKTLLPYKKVNGKKVERWATQKVNAEIMQGIVQGESIPKMAKRLQKVTEMDKASAIRNARTTTTSAENKGRQDSYIEAEAEGIILRKIWMATHDPRTREEHIELDGQEREIDEPFENSLGEIMYPGDPDADPANVYNCRCTLTTRVIGFKNKTQKANEEDDYVSFTEKEQEALHDYTTSMYSGINSLLREGGLDDYPDAKEIVKQIDSAMEKSVIKEGVITSRGASVNELEGLFEHKRSWFEKSENLKSLEGKTATFDSYLSTTKGEEVAQSYKRVVQWHFETGEKVHGIDMEPFSGLSTADIEKETLFNRGTIVEIQKIDFQTDEDGDVIGVINIWGKLKNGR